MKNFGVPTMSSAQPSDSSAADKRRKFYTIVDAAVMQDAGDVPCVDLLPDESEMGRYTAQSPYQAAKKAATKLYGRFKSHGVDAGCFCFGIREQTRNAPRVMRLYVARRVRLAKPVEWPRTRRNSTDQLVSEINVRDTETRIKAVLDADEVAAVLARFAAKKNLTEEYRTTSGAAAGAAGKPAAPARPDIFSGSAAFRLAPRCSGTVRPRHEDGEKGLGDGRGEPKRLEAAASDFPDDDGKELGVKHRLEAGVKQVV